MQLKALQKSFGLGTAGSALLSVTGCLIARCMFQTRLRRSQQRHFGALFYKAGERLSSVFLRPEAPILKSRRLRDRAVGELESLRQLRGGARPVRAQVSYSEQDPDGELLLPLKTAKKGKAKKKAVGRHPQTRAWQRRVAQGILFVSSCDHIEHCTLDEGSILRVRRSDLTGVDICI